MSTQEDYDNDILTLEEDINFNSPQPINNGEIDVLTGLIKKPKPANIPIINSPEGNNTIPVPPPRLTPHTKPVLQQPGIANGRQIHDLNLLKVTTTLDELRRRSDNSHQCFITRENIRIYFDQTVLNRIKFEEIRKTRRDKTINLPERYQARLRVTKDGKILFHDYHKRGLKKRNARRQCFTQRFNGEEYVWVPTQHENIN